MRIGDRDDPSVLDEAGQALFRLGRIFARQPMSHVLTERDGHAVEVSRILVAQAVEAGPEEPSGDVTVGAVSARLGVDPSTASRLVADTIQAGYLSRTPSPLDARRAQLALTDAGRALLEDAHRYQRAVFDHLTRHWSDHERHEFARLLSRFVDAVADIHATPVVLDTRPRR